MFLKVCGITRLEDGLAAAAAGATALGFVLWPRSPRAVDVGRVQAIVAALPAGVRTVGVFVDESLERIREIVEATGLQAVQLHGDEPPSMAALIGRPILRSVTLEDAGTAERAWPADTTLLLDTADRVRRGGTGRVVDWSRAARVARNGRTVLAGGLTPDNVEEAVRTVRPFGVDVSSGVEASPGVKDAGLVSAFLANARRAFAGR